MKLVLPLVALALALGGALGAWAGLRMGRIQAARAGRLGAALETRQCLAEIYDVDARIRTLEDALRRELADSLDCRAEVATRKLARRPVP